MQKKKSFFFSFPRRSKFGEARVLAKSKRRKRRATKSREKCKRKKHFSFHFRDEVNSAKPMIQKVERNAKEKLVFL